MTVKLLAYLFLALRRVGVVAVAVAFPNLTLLVMQIKLRLIFPCSLSALLLSFLLSIVQRRSPTTTFSLCRPLITVGRDVNILLRHVDTSPSLRSSPHNDTADIKKVKEGTIRRGVQLF
jgi:hypothetical protein